MTVIAQNEDHPRFVERGELSHSDLEALAEHTASELLGVSAEEAFAMVERGELDGKAAEWPLLALRRLLNVRVASR